MKKSAVSAVFVLLFCFFSLLPLFSTAKAEDLHTVSFTDCFDTVCTLTAVTETSDDFVSLRDDLHAGLLRLHRLFDAYESDAPDGVYALNQAAGKEPVTVGEDLFALLSFALEAEKASGGAVSPTMGRLTLLWKKATAEGVPPQEGEILAAMAHSSPSSLVLDKDARTAFLADPEARVDLGAFAKGYAADRAKERILASGVNDFILSLGGNLYACGNDPRTGKPWCVGVRDPQNEAGNVMRVDLVSASLVTSGSYERFFDYDGRRFHHIIDPATGYPAEKSGFVSVSVMHERSTVADMLTTALFILPKAEGEALLNRYGGEALWVAPDGSFERTNGFIEHKNAPDRGDVVVLVLLALAGVFAALLLILRKKREKSDDANDLPDEKPEITSKNALLPMRFGKKDVLFLVCFLLLSVALPLTLLINSKGGKKSAVVTVGGEIVKVLPLDVDGSYQIETPDGFNLVSVENGRVRIASSDCRGQDCVHSPAIDGNSLPSVIACLPHRLTVSIEEE